MTELTHSQRHAVWVARLLLARCSASHDSYFEIVAEINAAGGSWAGIAAEALIIAEQALRDSVGAPDFLTMEQVRAGVVVTPAEEAASEWVQAKIAALLDQMEPKRPG
ncbi:hypothetical protein [Mycobacterium haemophilum]|uniref:Uncharacterized protein n=1 Tax=Mycobacterium haemophilum TaxID=29311 RepID=A0A0I9UHY7_9MYCO|nr:hypothetical protein [Mycobacterium haemophilum]KLO29523.1 hypothetical protein ABH39_12100 [Mycobacterium haemophilum]KLO35974.1 hypothetical protein ABH38_13940 [Mycobacterium haemophilum]KLO41533.1 hypothetical protein ABH37_13240 [Mycobacterium haemophilum]KLO49412.1 hypothetical protein ABH36_12500 [Mycobacterium haemophilum]